MTIELEPGYIEVPWLEQPTTYYLYYFDPTTKSETKQLIQLIIQLFQERRRGEGGVQIQRTLSC